MSKTLKEVINQFEDWLALHKSKFKEFKNYWNNFIKEDLIFFKNQISSKDIESINQHISKVNNLFVEDSNEVLRLVRNLKKEFNNKNLEKIQKFLIDLEALKKSLKENPAFLLLYKLKNLKPFDLEDHQIIETILSAEKATERFNIKSAGPIKKSYKDEIITHNNFSSTKIKKSLSNKKKYDSSWVQETKKEEKRRKFE